MSLWQNIALYDKHRTCKALGVEDERDMWSRGECKRSWYLPSVIHYPASSRNQTMIVNFQPCELQTNRFEYMTSLHTEMEDFGIILRIIV